jgi:hypothetical protein
MDEQRCLLTPRIIACEIAMVLNQQRPGVVGEDDTDVKVEFVADINSDGLYLQAEAHGVGLKQGPMRSSDLAMKLDPFSERFVRPIVAAFLNEFDKAALASFNVHGAARN